MKKGVIFLLLLLVIPFVSSADNQLLLSKEHIQLGDSFTITGENIKVNGNSYNGNAMILLNNGKEKYTLLTSIVNGGFERTAEFCKTGCFLPNVAGTYDVSVSLVDANLIEVGKVNLDKRLIVNDNYTIVLELKNVQVNPGEGVSISGSVQRKSDSVLLDSGDVKILFDGVEYKTTIINQIFEYEFNTAYDIKSNYHNVEVIVTDDKGNNGQATTQFFIVAVPKSLILTPEKDSYLPKEKVKISISLLDQAGDPLSQQVELKIYDPKNKRMLNEMVAPNQEYNFDLLDYSVPGDWLIIAKGSGLKDEKKFSVETVEKIEVKVNGQFLDITNVGNIKYVQPLSLIIEPDNFTSLRRTNINPGETITLPLNTLLDDGAHKINVENVDQSFDVNVVDDRNAVKKIEDFFSGMTGQAVRKPGTGTSSAPTVIMVILFLFLIMMGYTVYKKYKAGNINKIKFKEPKKVKDEDEEFAVAKKADVEDIRDRILRNLKESRKTRKEEKINDKDIIPIKPKPAREEKVEKVDFDEPMRRRGEERGEDGWTYF